MKPNQWYARLTLALFDVDVELVKSSHGNLSDLWVKEKLHEGGGDVFTGRHAGRLSHFTLKDREGARQVKPLSFVVCPQLWEHVCHSRSVDRSGWPLGGPQWLIIRSALTRNLFFQTECTRFFWGNLNLNCYINKMNTAAKQEWPF